MTDIETTKTLMEEFMPANNDWNNLESVIPNSIRLLDAMKEELCLCCSGYEMETTLMVGRVDDTLGEIERRVDVGTYDEDDLTAIVGLYGQMSEAYAERDLTMPEVDFSGEKSQYAQIS